MWDSGFIFIADKQDIFPNTWMRHIVLSSHHILNLQGNSYCHEVANRTVWTQLIASVLCPYEIVYNRKFSYYIMSLRWTVYLSKNSLDEIKIDYTIYKLSVFPLAVHKNKIFLTHLLIKHHWCLLILKHQD